MDARSPRPHLRGETIFASFGESLTPLTSLEADQRVPSKGREGSDVFRSMFLSGVPDSNPLEGSGILYLVLRDCARSLWMDGPRQASSSHTTTKAGMRAFGRSGPISRGRWCGST